MKIYISGVFDMFHYGHMKLLNNCRNKFPGDTLIVGVHGDEDCKNYKRIPIMTHDERVAVIREFFKYSNTQKRGIVLENAPLLETKEFYLLNGIDKVVHAHKIEDDEFYINKFYKYANDNGMFERLDYTREISTTDIINRIREKMIDTTVYL